MSDCIGTGCKAESLRQQITSLQAERDALRKDAERYRWLRGDVPEHYERWMRWELRRWDGRSWRSLKRTALDAAIDAALAAKEIGK